MKQYALHPICQLFPPLGKEELQELADDIRINGLLHSIILYEGKILDGRNRLLACPMAGVEPRFEKWKGPGSPLQSVISENLIRRHLTSSQKAVIAHDLLPLLEKEARERQQRGKTLDKNLSKVSSNGKNGKGKASQIAARITKTNCTYVQAIKSISSAAPELLDKIRAGVLKVPDAARVARLPRAERCDLLKRCNGGPLGSGDLHDLLGEIRREHRHKAAVAFARRMPADHSIIIGDMGLLWKRLNDSSVDLVITDPPYAEIESYERLAELAAAKLKPSGLCLAYSGQVYLPVVMAAMAKHLKYWWTFAIRFSGTRCASHSRHIQNLWKPIVAFARPPIRPASEWLTDLLQGGGRDKTHHDWGQNQSEVEYLIAKLTEPGNLIVDPFCGGGFVPAACKRLGRRWIATEIDKSTALIARKRLAEVECPS